MQYAQLNEDGTYSHQITTSGNVEWDSTHFCPASALTPDEAAQFRVVPLLETDPPPIDPITQSVMRDGGELVDGQWQYRWRVDALSAEQIAANQAAAAEQTKATYTAALDAHYLAAAKARGYDTQYTCALRAGYPGPFHAEGVAFATWMDACNVAAYSLMTDVLAGTRPLPTMTDFIAGLPALTWPV